MEAVGDSLLLRDHFLRQGAEPKFCPLDGALLRGDVHAAGRGEQLGGLVAMVGCPGRRRGDLLG